MSTLKEIAKDLISGKIVLSEDELKNERMKVCEACDHFKRGLKQCDLCGCFMELKTKFIKAECPIGKW